MIECCGSDVIQMKGIYKGGGEVDILIGMTKPELHEQLSLEMLSNGLAVKETRFGYSLVGSTRIGNQMNYRSGAYQINNISIIPDEEENLYLDQLQAELAGITREVNQITEEELKFEERLIMMIIASKCNYHGSIIRKRLKIIETRRSIEMLS